MSCLSIVIALTGVFRIRYTVNYVRITRRQGEYLIFTAAWSYALMTMVPMCFHFEHKRKLPRSANDA